MVERISLKDDTLLFGFAIHMQRYMFAGRYCAAKRVLDAGCGTGYGAAYLASETKANVKAVDISEEAIKEAREYYRHENLEFLQADVERLSEFSDLAGPFDVIINLENIEHLRDAKRFLREARQLLSDSGLLVVSSPNGQVTQRDEEGNICNPFHIREYTLEEFTCLLRAEFATLEMHGQWQTPEHRARIMVERRSFETLCEIYYNPFCRLGRVIKRLFGKKCAGPPSYTAAGESYPWEHTIKPINQAPFPWPPEYLLAVCRP